MPSRREFLRTAAAATVAASAARRVPAAASRRPNFLFILTDDQRWDAMGFVQRLQGDHARFPWLRTPNLDRLAAEGLWLRNAFVVNSLCAPSRATFLTGQYGHANGVVNNHTPFPESHATHGSLLRAAPPQGAGYLTAYLGKWHMGAQSGQRPGFDYSASFIGQGQYVDCPIEVNGVKTPSHGWVDDVTTGYAEQFIRDNRARPWSLTLGFKAAHGPFEPPARRAGDYAGEQARAVPSLGHPAAFRPDAAPAPVTAEKVPVNLGYFRCLAAMDDNVGRLLKLLDELQLAEDTLLVFAGDNGYYFGEHGLGDKRSGYEESLRIPLLVRYPRVVAPGRVEERMALNVDLAPTLLDYAGVAVPKTMHGRSWRPLLESKPATDWRKAFFYCYCYERGFNTPTVTGVRTESAKLLKYPGHDDWTEVFDLKADPFELKNLAADPTAAELRKSLETEYQRQAEDIDFKIPAFADSPADDLPKGALQRWVLDYTFDRDKGDTVADASGLDNHGTAHGCPLVDGRDGRKARQFDGKGLIEVGKATSLNPVVAGWAWEATFRADQPDGVVLARGGATNGYALVLEGGKPVLLVVGANTNTRLAGTQPVTGGWVTVRGSVSADWQTLSLSLDGRPAGQKRLARPITQDPNDTMQIGGDTGSLVGGEAHTGFVGLVERVRIYSGVPVD